MPDTNSKAGWLASAPPAIKQNFLESLTDAEAALLLYDWPFWARQTQLPPLGDWLIWFLKAGRGFGKSRSGAEFVRARVESGRARRIALVAKTPADARDVMVEGESGLLNICPPWDRPLFEPSKRRVTWKNGAVATIYSDEVPGQLRGPQHDTAWVDELAKYKHPQETWDNLILGLRLSDDPRVVVTTTPTPIAIVKAFLKDPQCVVTGGSTYDNIGNLAPQFIRTIIAKYEGTRLGQQELHADVIEQAEGALWTREQIETARVQTAPALARIVVAIDPAVTSKKDTSDECGIVVAGVGEDGDAYVLDDLSDVLSPDAWARRAVGAYHAREADRIVAEVNNGGDLVEFTVRTVDRNVAYTPVRASRGKRTRAEPVAALYEQGRVHHIGYLADLETQMCTWSASEGQDSPDRVDALVWALTELMLHETDGAGFLEYAAVKVSEARALKASIDAKVAVSPETPVEEPNPWMESLGTDRHWRH